MKQKNNKLNDEVDEIIIEVERLKIINELIDGTGKQTTSNSCCESFNGTIKEIIKEQNSK